MNTRADVPPDLSLDFHRVGIKYDNFIDGFIFLY